MSTAILESPAFPLARITVDQYHRMIEAGVLTDEDRIELIEGYLVTKMTKNPPHCATLRFLNQFMVTAVPNGLYISTQDPVTLDNSEPEPDLAVIEGSPRDHVHRHPGPSEIALIVEVADSSIEKDRRMAVTYARNRIPIYWLVNLIDEQVEVFEQPEGSGQHAGYQNLRTYHRGDSIPCVIGGESCSALPVDDILP